MNAFPCQWDWVGEGDFRSRTCRPRPSSRSGHRYRRASSRSPINGRHHQEEPDYGKSVGFARFRLAQGNERFRREGYGRPPLQRPPIALLSIPPAAHYGEPGQGKDLDGHVVNQGIAVYGNKGSTDQHAYVQQLREGVSNFFVTFIEVLEDRNGESIDVEEGVTSGDYLHGFYMGTRDAERKRPEFDHDYHEPYLDRIDFRIDRSL